MSDERHNNCWTCSGDKVNEHGEHECHRPTCGKGVEEWITENCSVDMPSHVTPPCPGWKSRLNPFDEVTHE